MGKVRRSRTEREDVPVVSADWVEKNRHILTPRDIEMMRILTKFPLAKVEHLYHLTPKTTLPNGTTVSAFWEASRGIQICRDRLRRLFDAHFINKDSPRLSHGEGTSPQYVWLDRAGYKLFELEGRPAKQLSNEYLHHSHILDTYVEAIRLEREGIIQIDYITACYTDKPKTSNIEPDVILAFRKGQYGYRYLIEVDSGEKKESEELGKLDRYKDWQLSGQWIKEPWANLYKRKFPTVLYMFSGTERRVNRRLERFREKADEIDCRGDFIKLTEFRNKMINLGE